MPFQSSESIFQSLLLVAMCIAAGAFLSTQSGINARLSAGLQSPLMAALISFGTGTVVLLLATLLLQELKPLAGAANLPWWVWTGGILGAFIVATIVFAAPKIGALVLVASLVLGQVIASLVFDQFGWLGYPQISISPQRLIGAALILIGMWLVANK
jgi:bacterial/archaeal transporter family-2 protein